MILIIISTIIHTIHPAHIYSQNHILYNKYDATPHYYSLFFKLSNILGKNDYIKIVFPQPLTDATSDQVKTSLFIYDSSLNLKQSTCVLTSVNICHSTFGTALKSLTWYQLRVYPNKPPGKDFGTLQMYTQSAPEDTNVIVYDSNPMFGHLKLRDNSAISALTNIQVQNHDPKVSQISYIKLKITPNSIIPNDSRIEFQIYADPDILNHNKTDTKNLDFLLVALCKSTTLQLTCLFQSVSKGSAILQQEVLSGEQIQLEIGISNPQYTSERGIRVAIYSPTGKVIQWGKQDDSLNVNQIGIKEGTPRIIYYYGIDEGDTDLTSDSIHQGIFTSQNIGGSFGPLNSLNIGFQVQDTTPINSQFNVKMGLGANCAGVVQSSILSNLPSVSGKKVRCSFNVDENNILCVNVGALVRSKYRYFISFRGYYSYSSSNSFTDVGTVSINSIIYDAQSNLINANLFTQLSSVSSVPLVQNSQLLDTSGWHYSTKKIGQTQIVSAKDDNTLRSTANAVKQILQGTNSTVGIIPDPGYSQQLLFFTKMTLGSSSATNFTMKVVYNAKVISFEQDMDTAGLDIVAYSSSDSYYSIQKIKCYSTTTAYCQNDKNSHKTVYEGTTSNKKYGVFIFECSSTSNSNCYNFKGMGTSDSDGGVFAMRKVKFPQNYHNQVYGDQNSLDFIIILYQDGVAVSWSLLNGYSVEANKMVNIKTSLINYYDDGSYKNQGDRLPTMLRIGGGVLYSEYKGANKMAIFVDSNWEVQNFAYQQTIGCSTSSCSSYDNKGVKTSNDIWQNLKMIKIQSLPSIQTQFSVLIPFHFTNHPISLHIAFLSPNYTTSSLTGLDRIISIFRINGPALQQSVNSPISNFNNMNIKTYSPILNNFQSDWMPNGNIGYQIDGTKVYQNPPSNLFSASGNSITYTAGQPFGAGITISSLVYNIFNNANLSFSTDNIECTSFGYYYSVNKQNIYVSFCPLDSDIDLTTSSADIIFQNPKYSNYFTNQFPLKTILSYSFSDNEGYLKGFKIESNSPTKSHSCYAKMISGIRPNSVGNQKSQFTFTFKSITMSNTDGYSQFKIKIQLPKSGVTISQCSTDKSFLLCSQSSFQFIISLDPSDTSTYIVNTLNLNVVASAAGALSGTGIDFNAQIILPQQQSGSQSIFGNAYTFKAIFATCANTFQTSDSSYDTQMTLTNFQVQNQATLNTRTTFSFNFGSKSFRDVMYKTDSFVFDFGELAQSKTLDKGFMCIPYQQDSNANRVQSTLFSNILFADQSSVKLFPKDDISQPNTLKFWLKCIGGELQTDSSSGIKLKWVDSSSNQIQKATQPLETELTLTSPSNLECTLTKSLNTKSFESFYTFSLTLQVKLTYNSRIIFQFGKNIMPGINRDKNVDCYLRTSNNAVSNDVDAVEAYCQIKQRRINVWSNMQIEQNVQFYLDILGITQMDSGSVQKIWVGFDQDTLYSNGIHSQKTINDIPPLDTSGAFENIKITSTTATNLIIRQKQHLSITYQANPGNIYLRLHKGYAIWLKRGAPIPCQITDALNVNLTNKCTLISKKIIKVQMNGGGTCPCTIKLINITSPANLPVSLQNRFSVLLFKSSDMTGVDGFSYQIESTGFNWQKNNLIDLEWQNFKVQVLKSQIKLSQRDEQVMQVYVGYYKNVLELRQSIYPQNFRASFTFDLENTDLISLLFFQNDHKNVDLGIPTSLFRIAADPKASGLNYISVIKSNDKQSLYSQLPPLPIVILNTECQIQAQQSIYNIPINGISLPIILDFYTCFPITNITVEIDVIDKTNTSNPDIDQITLDTDLTRKFVNATVQDGKVYLILRHSGSQWEIGNNIQITLKIQGENKNSYSSPSKVKVFLVDPIPFSTKPIATPITSVNVSGNSAQITMQCSSQAWIYWGIGLTPILLQTQGLVFQTRILEAGKGLFTNFTQKDDYYWRIYGVDYNSVSQPLKKSFKNLKSSSNYQVKYFCINQLTLISDSALGNFTTPDNGAYLMKSIIYYQKALSFSQINQLSCALAQKFNIRYQRIMTEQIVTCNNVHYLLYSQDTTIVPKNKIDNLYPYMFYTLPDYTAPSDNTNIQIRQLLANTSFASSLSGLLPSGHTFPILYNIQSQDIQSFTGPLLTVQSIVSGLNGIAIIATITNVNGYIVAGIKTGIFDQTTMTLPNPANIKKGLFQINIPLLKINMKYSPKNMKTTLKLQGLQAQTKYTVFYFSSIDNPDFSSLSSQVKFREVSTLDSTSIQVIWSQLMISLGMIVVWIL